MHCRTSRPVLTGASGSFGKRWTRICEWCAGHGRDSFVPGWASLASAGQGCWDCESASGSCGRLPQGLPRLEMAQDLLWNSHRDIGREDTAQGSQEVWPPSDPCVYHSWIIGAAVVNAFYSPNRNQIGRLTPQPLPASQLPPPNPWVPSRAPAPMRRDRQCGRGGAAAQGSTSGWGEARHST